jgi:hypothetical protein
LNPKGKQPRQTDGENRNKKYTDFQKRHNRKKSVNSKNRKKLSIKKQTAKTATARNKEHFLWETYFLARTNKNSPVRFGAIKEGVKQPHRAGLQTNVASRNGRNTCILSAYAKPVILGGRESYGKREAIK